MVELCQEMGGLPILFKTTNSSYQHNVGALGFSSFLFCLQYLSFLLMDSLVQHLTLKVLKCMQKEGLFNFNSLQTRKGCCFNLLLTSCRTSCAPFKHQIPEGAFPLCYTDVNLVHAASASIKRNSTTSPFCNPSPCTEVLHVQGSRGLEMLASVLLIAYTFVMSNL